IQCAAVIVFFLAFAVMMFFVFRTLRRMNCRPKYLPGKFLKEKWRKWDVGGSYGQVAGSSNNHDQDTAYRGAAESGSEMNTNTVRRETSVRSIATLPAYSPSPKPTEQIIAREGERGGMDVVVEFPETAEEEEGRREELMESLYQIRLQRRQELAEREARRQARREARDRGDFLRLEELRMESRRRQRSRSTTASGSNSTLPSSTNVAEHQTRGRDRRISRVNYASLGCVRHDGTRVRSTSPDSDNRPLLSNAASMNVDGNSSLTRPTSFHSRGESYSSANSMSTRGSDGDSLTPVASHATSNSGHSGHSGHEDSTAPSRSGAEEGDVGALHIPPPDYDHLDWGEAPAYESPTTERNEHAPRLPQLQVPLPTIHIDAASPVSGPSP
ncbi:hypothetical protein ASPWEDRAFT_78968, partial [Aspergillus wentii DTO 134E9]